MKTNNFVAVADLSNLREKMSGKNFDSIGWMEFNDIVNEMIMTEKFIRQHIWDETVIDNTAGDNMRDIGKSAIYELYLIFRRITVLLENRGGLLEIASLIAIFRAGCNKYQDSVIKHITRNDEDFAESVDIIKYTLGEEEIYLYSTPNSDDMLWLSLKPQLKRAFKDGYIIRPAYDTNDCEAGKMKFAGYAILRKIDNSVGAIHINILDAGNWERDIVTVKDMINSIIAE